MRKFNKFKHKNAAIRIVIRAGAAKRDAKIWEEYLSDLAIPFERRKPEPGRTKWSEDYWKRITGYTGRTSNHARDAALLVFGYCNR